MKKRIMLPVGVLLFSLLLGGCGSRTIDEMYSLPKRSTRNNNLQLAVETAMDGKVFAAPVSGDNQESVQTADLDGDGKEEYIVFAKGGNNDSIQVLLFKAEEEDQYKLWETVTCKGSSFEQVQYADMDDRPGMEMILGTRINEQVAKTVSIYSFGANQPEKIKSILYQKYLPCDLNGDGRCELLVIQRGEAEANNGVVRLYSYKDGSVQGSEEAMLSSSAEQIRRIAMNRLSTGEPAVYVASINRENAIVTDIFAMREDTFRNISSYSEFGTSMGTLLNHYVYAEDIDSDGTLELPALITMMYNATEQNLVRWYSMDIYGEEKNKLFTFHNLQDGWYLALNSDWIDRFAAENNNGVYTFYMWNNSYGSAVPVFTIYALTERDRDIQASAQNRFALHRGEDVVYAAKLESGSAIYGITENYLVSNFHLIRQDWKAPES